MRTRRLLLFGAGLIAACSSSSHPSGPTTGIVRGVVSSSLGGGLTGLNVTVTPASGTSLPAVVTGAGGAFSVLNVPVGSGSVSVSGQPALCAAPTAAAYAFGGGDTAVANVRITCTQPIGALAGTVLANYGSNVRVGAAGATVTVTPTGETARPAVTADGNGNFQVDSIPLPVVNGVAQPGSGTIVIGGTLPAGCTPPVSVPYSGLADTNTAASPLAVVTQAPCMGSTLKLDVTWPLEGGPIGTLNGPSGTLQYVSLFPNTYSPTLPGTYYVSALPLEWVNDSIIGTAAVLHLSGSPVTLVPGASATINVTYAERPGTGQIWIASSRGATGYTPNALIQSGVASGNTIPVPLGAPRAITTDSGGNLWTTGSFGVAEYSVATLPLRSGPYAAPVSPSFTFALPHASTGAAGIIFDPSGHLWVADIASAAIYEYGTGSATPLVTIAGSPLRAPIRIAFDGNGDLWVADTLARSVFMYTAAQIQSSGAPSPQALSLASVLPGGGPYAIAFSWGGDFYVGGATNEGPAGQDSGLVAWFPGVYPQYITTPYQIWRFPGQSFAPGSRPARPPVLDLAADHTLDVWAIGNNGVVNFVYDSIVRFNANPPVVVASATDLSGLAFDLSPLLKFSHDTSVTTAPARARRRPATSRRGELSRAGVRP